MVRLMGLSYVASLSALLGGAWRIGKGVKEESDWLRGGLTGGLGRL